MSSEQAKPWRAVGSVIGPDVVAKLLPQGDPIRLVDAVVSWQPKQLQARFRVPPDHPVLAGHFPGRPLWPGVYLIEGLAQSALLLGVLSTIGEVPPESFEFKVSTQGLLAAVDVKLTAPVMPGDTIDYSVAETHVIDALRRYAVDAHVAGRPVARGALTVAIARSP